MNDIVTPFFRPEPPMTKDGKRYLLPNPETGRDMAWTRATTWAKAIADMKALGNWDKRMVAKGIATRPDLYALAAATPIEDKRKLDEIAEDAREAAKASSGRNLGKALHTFTEQLDSGAELTVPEPWDQDIAAYQQALAAERVTVLPDYIERVVLVPVYKVAGTLDRIVDLNDGGLPVIADVKTTQNIDYSWGEIAIQLALYANAAHLSSTDYKAYEPMPALDTDRAVVMHLPAGQARCDLYTVNIAAGWEAAYICKIVREWRNRKDLAVPYRFDRVLEQIKAAPTRAALEALWTEVAGFGQWTDAHTAAATVRVAELDTAGEAGGTKETASEGEAA